MKVAAQKEGRRFLSLRGPLCAGEAFSSGGSCGGRAAQAKRVAPVVASSSTPHFAAAPRLMLLAYGQAGGYTPSLDQCILRILKLVMLDIEYTLRDW